MVLLHGIVTWYCYMVLYINSENIFAKNTCQWLNMVNLTNPTSSEYLHHWATAPFYIMAKSSANGLLVMDITHIKATTSSSLSLTSNN